jgi:hypothetical protein
MSYWMSLMSCWTQCAADGGAPACAVTRTTYSLTAFFCHDLPAE